MKRGFQFISRAVLFCLAVAGMAFMAGCGETNIGHSGDASDEYENIPWSRPEPWEGGAGFGGFGQQN